MGPLVLDASAVVDFLIEPAGSPLDRLLDGDADLHTPAICDVEVVGAIAGQERRGRLSEDDARQVLLDFVSLPIARHMHVWMIGRAWELRRNMTATDATYVALAEVLGADLVTTDRSLARAVRRHTSVRCRP